MKHNGTKIALILVLSILLFSGCKDFWHPEGSPSKNNPDSNGNPFIGTWYGTWADQPLILIFQESFYSWTLPDGGGWGFSGSYTYSGNSATLYGDMPGTAEISGSSLTLTCPYFGGNDQVICEK